MDRIIFLKDFIGKNPGDMFARHALALEYIKQGDDQEAEKLFREILMLQPNYVGSYYHLGKLLERGQRQIEAIAIYEMGIKEAALQQDMHNLRELKAAFNQLNDEIEL
jgi:tetratricopeptide (TPR) repeat protein